MTNKIYDYLKDAQIVIPAMGALYAGLAAAWNWPASEAVVASCGVISAFLGVLLKMISNKYFADKEIVTKSEEVEG